MTNELLLDALPDLPQRATIEEISTNLWQQPEVVAFWLGGSLAHGDGDIFSDIDFRVAVGPEQVEAWKEPRFAEIFTSAAVAGQQFLAFGNEAFLHHLVLSNGEIIDFFVQSTTREPTQEPRLVLGCRNEKFAQILATNQSVERVEILNEVDAAAVQRALTAFWINTHKHRKVLHRGLDLLVNFGFDVEKALLLRLWYIEVSGKDCGDLRQGTIHSLTRIMRELEQAVGDEARGVIGAPMRNRQEIYRAIEGNREVVARIGRHLAQTYGFAYPAELETTARQGWRDFLAAQ